MSEPLLSVRNLKKYYPIKGGILLHTVAQVHAVDDVSFDVYPGETLGLVGESGCGKSTIVKTLLRLHEPDAGQVLFAGQDLLALGKAELRALREDIQIIFQDPAESLNARQTVGAIVQEPFIIHNIGTETERKQWVAELLERVGMPTGAADRYPHEFSGGQRQRIGIARAIALKPRLLICDEPVSALDVSIQSQIINLLLELQQELQLTMLFIAHDLSVVKHVSDRLAVMYLGKIVEIGEAAELYAHPVHPYTRALVDSIPLPDPGQDMTFDRLQGEVPSPVTPPSGCYFHGRCPYVEPLCKTQRPALIAVQRQGQPEREVACHLYERFL
ncbi:MAG: ABC transporter ATP-binding protein [Gammaproteobacteria bacterium]